MGSFKHSSIKTKRQWLWFLMLFFGCVTQVDVHVRTRTWMDGSGVSNIISNIPLKDEYSTEKNDQSSSRTDPLVFDLLSIGSNNLLEYQAAQRLTMGSHRRVRTFFATTEDDDADQHCHTNLTVQDTMSISKFCRSRHYDSPFMSYMRNQFASQKWLEKKKHPVGWLCAIPRPISGLYKALRSYGTRRDDLPDYLIMIDDDTYMNLDGLQQILAPQHASHTPKVFAGCLVRQPIHMLNFTFGWGGFGVVWSRSAIEKLLCPIHCPTDTKLCEQILDTNLIGEKEYFSNGMSVIDLMVAVVKEQMYTDFHQWTIGNCLHADWLIGYMVNFYNISQHNDDNDYYANVPQERTVPLLPGSEVYRRRGGQCENDAVEKNCPDDALVCHHMTPQDMMMRMKPGKDTSV